MQKRQMNVTVDDEVIKRLNTIADRYGLTANTVMAAAAYELSRVRPENLWHALGRIAADEGQPLPPEAVATLPAPRKQAKRAIPV